MGCAISEAIDESSYCTNIGECDGKVAAVSDRHKPRETSIVSEEHHLNIDGGSSLSDPVHCHFYRITQVSKAELTNLEQKCTSTEVTQDLANDLTSPRRRALICAHCPFLNSHFNTPKSAN